MSCVKKELRRGCAVAIRSVFRASKSLRIAFAEGKSNWNYHVDIRSLPDVPLYPEAYQMTFAQSKFQEN